MPAKPITVAFAAAAVLAASALAQTAPPAGDQASTPSNSVPASSLQGDWRVSKMVGLSVYNDTNENLGSINELLMDKSGSIKAVVLGVGGFLGVGQHLVAVPLDKITFVDQPVADTGIASGGAPTKNRGATTGSVPTKTPQAANQTANQGSSQASKPHSWYPDHAVFEATGDELKAMPEFKYAT